MNTRLDPHFSNYLNLPFPKIRKPNVVGYFSINENREIVYDHSRLQYLKLPSSNFSFDLNIGFENFISKPDQDEKIDFLLRYILTNSKTSDKVNQHSRPVDHDFVCFRGLLRLIMCTPYENRENWIILATKYKGTIYLCAQETDEKKARAAEETQQSKKFCYYGHKFENYFSTSDPNIQPDTQSPIELSNEFCCMFETKLENFKILYGAEMDGINQNDIITESTNFNELEFIELKVKRHESNFRQTMNFYKFKAIKWWCQCFLVGISKIIVGLRNDKGIVTEFENVDVRRIARESRDYWLSSVCMRFCFEFLDLIVKDMENIDCPFTVLKYSYIPHYKSNIKLEIMRGKNPQSFLPNWYYKHSIFKNNN